MILGYAARNAMTPKVNPEMLAKFQAMAHKENPGLAAEMPNYHGIGQQLAQRIDTLDPDRRRLAHDDLNQNLLGHVQGALASGKTAPAVQAIRAQLEKLAQQHGVQLPQQVASGSGIPGYPNLPPWGTPMPAPTRLESPGLGAAVPIPPKQ